MLHKTLVEPEKACWSMPAPYMLPSPMSWKLQITYIQSNNHYYMIILIGFYGFASCHFRPPWRNMAVPGCATPLAKGFVYCHEHCRDGCDDLLMRYMIRTGSAAT